MPGNDPATWNYSPTQVHSTYAAGSITIEASGVVKLMQQLQGAGVKMQDDLVAYTFDLLKRIAMKTPVDTGRARASWHAVLPNTTDFYMYHDLQGKEFNGTLADTTTGPWDTVVGSNVEYMIFLEAGHSRQAPEGMVTLSLLELRGALQRRLEDTIAKAAQR